MLKKVLLSTFLTISLILFNFSEPTYAEKIDNVQPGNAYLAEDSILSFKLLDKLDSNTAKKFDTIRFVLVKDITVKNKIVIPKDTVLSAVITKTHSSRILGQSGIIRLKINDYKINDTHTLHFKDDLKFKGGHNYANAAASIIIPFSGLLFKGKEIQYSPGTVIEYKLNDNLDLGINEAQLLSILP